jgi:hypothetical protein
MSQAQLESKVHDYLRKSQALQDYWQQPITSEQLQAEMNRMAKHSKQPEVLRKLFQALGNDPFVIAECLARPVLADRLVTKLQNEEGVQVTTVAWLRDPPRSGMSTAETQAPKKVAAIDSIAKAVQVNRPYRLPALASPSAGCIDDTWTPTSTENVPDARASNTAVWTGSEMIVWGGEYGWASLNDGGRYNPNTNTWTTPSTTSDGRYLHTAVWTGSEMIVWGGAGDINFWSTGGRYHPASDSWTATSTLNAPAARSEHTAVWTGSEMIGWGGQVGWDYFNTGGRYCGQTAPPPRSIPTPRPRCSPAPRP